MRKRLLICVILAALPLAAALTQPVRTDSGLVSGVPGSHPSVVAFKGIPFAAPPVDDLRWRSPKPPASWQGVKKADQFSDSCIQNIVRERKPWTYEFMPHNGVSENCLYLNVWTGATASTERLPVLVWLHGGGYTEGSTAVPIYDGENLAKSGIVVVTINYRLGVLGFLAHPDLTAESNRNASGNYGTLDQIAALEWVKKNIAVFGGDPKRVTLGGQSAGAGAVHNLTASPLAKGLFVRAIAQSGSGIVPAALSSRFMGLGEAEEQGVKFAGTKSAHSIKELRAVEWHDLAASAANGPSFSFRPIIDGWGLPAPVDDIFAQGKQSDVPTLTGLVADESSSQADYGAIPAEQWNQQVLQRFGDLADAFLKLYPAATDAQAGASQVVSSRDRGLVSMHLWAERRAKTAKTKVYTYYWTHAQPGPDSARYGAFHSSEVPYVFFTLKTSDRPWAAEDRKIAETIGAYWVNFITTGDPNGKGLAQWPPFREQAGVTMELGDRFGPRPVAEKSKIDFLKQYFSRPNAASR